MNYVNRFTCISALLAVTLLAGCGPSEEEQRQAEQARQDSIAQARQDSMQQVRQQRRDSLAQARADSMNENGNAADFSNVTFSPSGSFSIQVEAWRSQNKAQERADQWQERGFNNASVVAYGKKETGNIWYRVRLGRVQSRQDAQRLQEQLNQEFQAQSWIANPS